MIIGKTKIYKWWKNTVAKSLKKKRLDRILRLAKIPTDKKINVLEIGCGNGKDVVQFLNDGDKYEVWGLDILEQQIEQDNFTFIKGDAASLPFEDKSFDLVISVGLLEHIEEIETLCKITKEIDRVSDAFVVVVPCLSTFVESHNMGIRWPMRLHKNYTTKNIKTPLKLNFYSDHTWTKFPGFFDADVERCYYIPPLIKNTIIYKSNKS